jgi:hypothetical protein
VTSLSRLAARDIAVEDVRPVLERHLAEVFDLVFTRAPESISGALRPVAA